MDGSFPLTQDHLAALNAVLDTEPWLRPLLQKCQNCNCPVNNEIDALNSQMERAKAIKAQFFPHEM